MLVAMALSSCDNAHSPLKLTEKEILAQCNRHLEDLAINALYVPVETGYYELSDESERCQLQELEAAGVINYDVERFAWWDETTELRRVPHTVIRYGVWGPYEDTEYTTKMVTTYDLQQHFMVNVSLTAAANNYAVDSLPAPKILDKPNLELQQPVFYDSLYPEYHVDCTENWPEMKHPLADETFRKCMETLAEMRRQLNDVNDLEGIEKVMRLYYYISDNENISRLTSEQKAEVDAESNALAELVNKKLGNIAYANSIEVIIEATTDFNAAMSCHDIDRVIWKLNSLEYVDYNDKMNQDQIKDIKSKEQALNALIVKKQEKLGCDPEEVPEEEPDVPLTPDMPEEEIQEQPKTINNDPQALAYKEAKEREHMETRWLRATLAKAFKAENINLMLTEDGTSAEADVYYKTYNATDAGRAIMRIIDGMITHENYRFNYYCDKGWVLDEESAADDEMPFDD